MWLHFQMVRNHIIMWWQVSVRLGQKGRYFSFHIDARTHTLEERGKEKTSTYFSGRENDSTVRREDLSHCVGYTHV